MRGYLREHQNKKDLIAIFVTLLAVVVPMLQYNSIHLLLFNFYNQRFELFFHAWEVNTAGLISIFVLFAAVVILLFNFTYSRYFCGNICPKTLLKNLFTDTIETRIFHIFKIKNRDDERSFENNRLKLFFAYSLLALVIMFGSMPIFFYFIPYDIFFSMLKNYFHGYTFLLYIWLLSATYLFAEILFFKEFFCAYICPYQLVNSTTVNEQRAFYVFDTKEKCIDCEACVNVCPVPDLDVRKGYDTRCIACGDCSAVCHDVMQKRGGGKSLIEYKDFNKRKSLPYFSFAGKRTSLLLIALTLAGSSLIVYYLISPEHLSSCNIANAFLYRD